ncbi:hypothetical protein FRB93_001230 [Tulasnella sp. JGI-2019a]|nr:hypothetical protein FRB93_001230 [Tulasnella sp. JGI-2019a]
MPTQSVENLVEDWPPSSGPTNLSEVSNAGLKGSFRYVKIMWVGLANDVQERILPCIAFVKALEAEPRPNIRIGSAVFGYVAGSLAPGFGSSGSLYIVPYRDSIRSYPYEDGVASVFAWIEQINVPPESHRASPYCPRSLLHKVVHNARVRTGIEFLVGFETEFILLKSTEPPIKVTNQYGFNSTNALRAGSEQAVILREIADSLIAGGIELLAFHSEAAPDQYEVVTGPLPPLEAADALVYTRETIMHVANRHGYRATLSPRVSENFPGSGAHAHISVLPLGEPITTTSEGASGPTPVEASFLSGVLEHLAALQVLMQPLPASFERVQDGLWAGGTWAAWGTENKELAIRFIEDTTGGSQRFEVRGIDGTSNPYLALAGIISAGFTAVQCNTPLLVKDLKSGSPSTLDDSERKALGITTRLC